MLDMLEGHPHYRFLDVYSIYSKISISLNDQEKTTFTCLYDAFAFRRIPFGLCNALATFQKVYDVYVLRLGGRGYRNIHG